MGIQGNPEGNSSSVTKQPQIQKAFSEAVVMPVLCKCLHIDNVYVLLRIANKGQM